MKHIFTLLFFTSLTTLSLIAEAKTCTSSTILASLKSKKRFVWAEEKCSNTSISVSKPLTISISGATIDGSNKLTMKWKGKHKCDEKPSSDTIFTVTGSKITIKNLKMDWSPEGIHLKGSSNTVDNVTWIKICEDGLTNTGKGNVIKNSLFQNAPDKCVQTNGGSATFINNTFKKCPRSIGSCSDKADPGNHPTANCKVPSFNTAISNKVYGCRNYAFRASGKKSKKANGWLKAINNEFYDCDGAMQSEEDGDVYASDNRVIGGTAFDTETKYGKYNAVIRECNTSLEKGARYYTNKKPKVDCNWD
ncbi:MAG: pectate lyase [Bdellovibrionota bacterium]